MRQPELLEQPEQRQSSCRVSSCQPDASAPGVKQTWRWVTRASDRRGQVFHIPIAFCLQKSIGGGAVLPYRVTNGVARIGLQQGLSEQSAEVAGEQITTPALGQERIPR